MSRQACLLAIATLSVVTGGYAQTTDGIVAGAVTDPSGAVVAGAQIDITSQETGWQRTAISGGNGVYIVPQLPPGVYSIAVRAQGFGAQNRRDVHLDVNQSVTLDFK